MDVRPRAIRSLAGPSGGQLTPYYACIESIETMPCTHEYKREPGAERTTTVSLP